MHNVTNPLQACNDIFYRPNGVFKAVDEHNNWSWLPFFIVVIVAVLPNYFYASFVDINWYQDLIIQMQYADQSPAEQDMFRQNMTRDAITMFSTVGTVVGLIVINTIIATYLNLVSKSDEENIKGFTDWYGFTWWVTLPILINSLFAMFLLFMADDHQVLPTIAAPLSLAYLFSIDMASPWFNLAQSIRLDSFFAIYLTAVGVSQWTRFTTRKSALIAVAPSAVIWGIWTGFILFS